MSAEVDDFLIHYGVKGMKWGKRKGHTESRREYKRRIKDERQKFDQDKLSSVLDTSMKKGEDVLIKTQIPGDYATTIMTGKQFVEMATSGSFLNARTTDVFATLDKSQGQFVLNETANNYIPSERR